MLSCPFADRVRVIYDIRALELGRVLPVRIPYRSDSYQVAKGAKALDTYESRVFIDRSLADTAYGEDLSSYLSSPYEGHPLSFSAAWVTSASQLGIDVASRSLALSKELSKASGVALAAAKRRQSENRFDAVLAAQSVWLTLCLQVRLGRVF
jgi:hypothetical protein